MSPEQKAAITTLRQEGLGYKAIATKLWLSPNTVKSFCQRQGLKINKQNQDRTLDDYCPVCGKRLHHIVGKKKKRFCSDSCRMSWWNSHQEEVKKNSFTEEICSFCHQSFSVYGKKNRKYCSHQCYINDRFGEKNDRTANS